MQCELCGNECGSKGKPAIVDGVKMILCPSCLKYAQEVKTSGETPPFVKQRLLGRLRRRTEKDIYDEMKKELVPNWSEIIRKAREKKGLTREELGFKVGEKTNTIAKIEKGELRPSDEVARKLEKLLSITLFEEVEDISIPQTRETTIQGFTLGDFIKREED